MSQKRDRKEYFARYRKENPDIRKAQAKRKRERYRLRGLNSQGKVYTLVGLTRGTEPKSVRYFRYNYPQATREDFLRYSAATECEVCGTTFSDGRGNRMKSQDHCHVTGKLRGVICHACNIAQGMLNSIDTARAMLAYFDRHGIIAKEREHRRMTPADHEPTLFDSPSSPPAPPLAPP
jgi:hypothetical protein